MDLDSAAVMIHEYYVSLVKAGFSKAQALDIVKAVILDQMRIARKSD